MEKLDGKPTVTRKTGSLHSKMETYLNPPKRGGMTSLTEGKNRFIMTTLRGNPRNCPERTLILKTRANWKKKKKKVCVEQKKAPEGSIHRSSVRRNPPKKKKARRNQGGGFVWKSQYNWPEGGKKKSSKESRKLTTKKLTLGKRY